eukprot:677859-Amorphochlora_amoeboformis.AAC.1
MVREPSVRSAGSRTTMLATPVERSIWRSISSRRVRLDFILSTIPVEEDRLEWRIGTCSGDEDFWSRNVSSPASERLVARPESSDRLRERLE